MEVTENLEQKNKIMLAVQAEFNEKGMKFTMDDIARRMGMSKKTLYLIFADKTALFEEMVKYTFDGIKRAQEKILADGTLSVLEKIRRVMIADPGGYSNLNMEHITQMREKFPNIYAKIREKLESGWEPTLELIRRGQSEGVIRDVDPEMVKLMVEGTIEHLLTMQPGKKTKLNYAKALNHMMDIIMEGIQTGGAGNE